MTSYTNLVRRRVPGYFRWRHECNRRDTRIGFCPVRRVPRRLSTFADRWRMWNIPRDRRPHRRMTSSCWRVPVGRDHRVRFLVHIRHTWYQTAFKNTNAVGYMKFDINFIQALMFVLKLIALFENLNFISFFTQIEAFYNSWLANCMHSELSWVE